MRGDRRRINRTLSCKLHPSLNAGFNARGVDVGAHATDATECFEGRDCQAWLAQIPGRTRAQAKTVLTHTPL